MRPISFRKKMIQAILNGRKTQTRRPCNPQPNESKEPFHPHGPCYPDESWQWLPEANRGEVEPNYAADDIKPRWWLADYIYIRTHRYMKRVDSPGVLRVKHVRVERVQNISSRDARLEGFWGSEDYQCIDAFVITWEDIYRKKPELQWDTNPWVWVIEFELTSKKAV